MRIMNTESRVFRALLVLIGVIVLSSSASACSCLPPGPPAEERNASDAVFAGTVDAITDSTTGEFMSPAQDKTVTFAVSTVWKGPEQETVDVVTADSSASCGFPFEEDASYLVYADRADDRLTVSLCSRTAQLENADEDVAALGDGISLAPSAQPAEDGSMKRPVIADQHIVLGVVLFLVAAVLLVLVYRRYW